MPYVTIEESVWVDLDDFETEDLISEIKNRGKPIPEIRASVNQLLNDMYLAKVRNQPYEHILNQLFYEALGKIL